MKSIRPDLEFVLSAEERRRLVRRVLDSNHFAKSARHREFLQYVCACALSEPPTEVNEQHIGLNVFGRPADYRSAEDNIVRVAARQLRIRLKEFFETEGSGEAWLIDIPKGSYLPIFVRRPVETPDAVVVVRQQDPAPKRSPHWVAVSVVTLMGVVAAGWMWREVRALTPQANLLNEIFSQSSNRLNIVVSDSTLVQIDMLSGEVVGLEDYANRKYPALRYLQENWEGRDQFSKRMATRQSTSLADGTIIAHAISALGRHRDKVHILHPRNVHTRLFHADDSLILGGVRSNPWSSLFEPQLNFYFGPGGIDKPAEFRNRTPLAGEQAVYAPDGADDYEGRSYARIALVRNLKQSGKVLLVSGTSMVAMEEAGNYLADPAKLPALREHLGGRAIGRMEYFELLFEVSAMQGASKGARLIAFRVFDATR